MIKLNFAHVEKQLDQKDKVNLKIYDVTSWETNSCNTHIAQYLKKCCPISQEILPNTSRNTDNQKTESGHLIEFIMTNSFLEKSCTKWDGEGIPKPSS